MKPPAIPRSTDLTRGVIWKQLVRFSIPLVLSSLLQSVYGMVDMIIAGQFIGSSGLSAVNNSSTIMLFVTQVLMGISTGGSILIGQFFGAKDSDNCKDSVTTLFTFSMALSVVLAVVLFVLARPMLVLLNAPTLEEATQYLAICAVGIIFISGYNAAAGAMRSVGNSATPLVCVAVTSVLNIVLDIVFVSSFNLGVSGLAYATVISQGVSFILSLLVVLRDRDLYGLRLTKLFIRKDKLLSMLKLGIPVCVQMTVANISWLSVVFLINSYGVFVSAGYGVSVKIKNFCLLFISAMSSGSTAMIAQNIGAREYDRARKVVYTSMRIAVGVSILIVMAVELFAPQLVSIFTSETETSEIAIKNLRIEIVSQIFYAIFLMYHALALGAGHTWFVLMSSFVNCILARLVLIFVLNHFIGLVGIYIACMVAPTTSVPIGFWYERSNRWRLSKG